MTDREALERALADAEARIGQLAQENARLRRGSEVTAEARDALTVALATAQPPDPVWAEDAAGSVNMSVNWPGWADAVIAALPDGWVLARREDAEDGAALRELREALPEGWDLIVRNFASRWGVELWDPRYPASRDEPPQPRYLEIEPTIAAAARKAKDALGGGS